MLEILGEILPQSQMPKSRIARGLGVLVTLSFRGESQLQCSRKVTEGKIE